MARWYREATGGERDTDAMAEIIMAHDCVLLRFIGDGIRCPRASARRGRDRHRRDQCTIVVGDPAWSRLGGGFPAIRIGGFMLRGRHTSMAAYRIDSAAARLAGVTPAAAPFDRV